MRKVDYTPSSSFGIKINDIEYLRGFINGVEDTEVIIEKDLLNKLLDQIENDFWEAKESGERM